ncbi:MAG: hypothetical protein CJD30_01840 [Sulfuricurvum sp. PD_MW2]|uniref:hypothetical protein n=1 Tax=Sulfuricurvum sp. PD_MW2 TaxID=2027917 RepID=UPI000C0649E4|nr:hypothetical protein [Sulfuricurvum sp. PD_MW2]PHM18681.1 MAG: hypothetical protein CJD30_01840 [Sulfuricurvum sp. PD_MW2]
MTTIHYDFKLMHKCGNSGTVTDMRGTSIRLKKDRDNVAYSVEKCQSINGVIDTIKAKSDLFDIHGHFSLKCPYFRIYVSIDDHTYRLSSELKIISGEEEKRLIFEPRIEYDLDVKDIRAETIQPLECHLLGKKVEEQIRIIEEYIKKPSQRFKKWEKKPRKLYLYHSFGEEAKTFEIVYN